MSNSVYEQLNRQQTEQQDMTSQYHIFRQNPIQFMAQRNLNIPPEYQNNPHEAVNYLIQSGRMDSGAMQKVMGTLQRMGFRF